MQTLERKRILVVGGSSGIGLGCAKMAADMGAKVTIAGRTQKRLDEAVKALGSNAEARQLDAADDAATVAFFKDAGTWDHVIASTGQGGRGKIQEQKMDAAYAAMEAKFWAYYRIARSAKIAQDGSLTLISGGLSTKPAPGASLVSAINGAVESMARGLALDFAPTRVNVVCPGAIDTPLWEQLSPPARKAMYERLAQTLPARRIGQPEDVAQAVTMLMTNPFATGSVLYLEGGALLL
jgi:NAD(P)-dependent dehydrogenase (short-subunit alcohol dehydrogenase family)